MVQTYPVSIPSVALALGMWQLAWHRAYGDQLQKKEPYPRGYLPRGSATFEYYEAIDRLSRGEMP